MKTFRNIIFWLHLISGVLAGIFIFIMCVTGALITFEPNILQIAESDQRIIAAPSADAARVPLAQMIEQGRQASPNAKPSAITLTNDPNAAALIALGREGKVYVNPYTGAVTGTGSEEVHEFFEFFENIHRWLGMSGAGRTVGKSLNDAANLLFLFLAISGVYIWFPRRFTSRHFKAALTPRFDVKGKARNFNWHTVVGFWTSLVLIILTLTGVIISYQWASNLLYTVTGNEPPAAQQGAPPNQNQQSAETPPLPENLDALWQTAERHGNWKTISLRLPMSREAAVFTIDEGIYWNKFGRSTLTVNPQTNQIVKWEAYGEQNSARQLRSWARFTHTGETFGLVGQFVAFLACLGGALLVYTGIMLSLARLKNWRKPSSSIVEEA